MESEGDSDEEDDFSDAGEPEYHPEADDAGEFWCPRCGGEMYGDATRCPRCGDFVTPGTRPSAPMPKGMWIGIVGIGILLLAALVGAAVLNR